MNLERTRLATRKVLPNFFENPAISRDLQEKCNFFLFLFQDVQMGHAPAPKAPKKAKEIPANPTDRHPVQLVSYKKYFDKF